MKFFIIVSFFSLLLFSRENPFFPIEGEDDLQISSNIVEHFELLKNHTIKLPDSARLIKNVSITYQNLDGSLAVKDLKLDNSIDWHLPILVSQVTSKNTVLPTTKSPNKKFVKAKRKEKFKKVYHYKFVTFYHSTNFMQLKVSDDLIRKFMMVNPHRVVLDFKRDALFLTKSKKLSSKFFKEIRIGNHDGYYRVVLELDGKYRYKIAKKSYGYLLEVY